MPVVTEIAPDVYRISVFYPEINLQFNHFLVNDDEPLLFHTGLRRMFSQVREGVAKVLDPARLRWVSWSSF
jgi:flavorubredoxin